jgi:plasmid stabilization system protein ParE
MRVRWTAPADLASIVEYIRKDNPVVARRVAETIYGAWPRCAHSGAAGALDALRTLANWSLLRGPI